MKRLLCAAAALLASPAAADTLIYNVNGIQVSADGRLERFRGLVIDDRGKVERLIRRTEELDRPVEREIDGGGRTLLPGLIDAHGHVLGLGFAALRLDLTGARSIDELKARLANYAAANPGSSWLIGRGWNQELWPGKRMPTAADLDAVVADRPVALERVDGHASVVNSAALEAAGITAATKDLAGGKIERDSNGNPTGLLIDSAAELVGKVIPPPTDSDRQRALEKAQAMLLASGITAAADMGTSAEDWNVLETAARSGKLQPRIMVYSAGLDPLQRIAADGPLGWRFADRLNVVGVKLYADGALGSRGAWLKRPYADRPDTRGLRFLTDEELQAQAGKAADAGFQLAIHAIGDAANDQLLSTFESLSRRHGRDRRWRIEHAQIVDPADIPRFAAGGVIASMQPVHQTSDRTMAEQRLDPPRLQGAYAWRSLLRSGARLAFGSDFPVESPNPFHGLSAAVSRQDLNGQPPGGWRPEERLTFAEALHAFTRGAAYASFAEDRIGSLDPGKWADFIIVDRDPTKVDAQSLARTRVLQTWVGGRLRFDAEAVPISGALPERGR